MSIEKNIEIDPNSIAIIGMSGKFPKADSIDEFWKNICEGKECITFHNEDELIEEGIDEETVKNPHYVKARGEINNIDFFDADFFNFSPREAESMDPQHRILLEVAWKALEDAGYDSEKYDGKIGIFAGESMNIYQILNLYPYLKNKVMSSASLQSAIGNDKDSLTTTISYKMNLTGPAITIQSSSSTSLVAICQACQSLLFYQCDMALAGGASVGSPRKSGYLYEVGGIVSSDGHCRPYDSKAQGFVPGSGAGIVVLKRLEDAIKDGDKITAVIKGFAVNNDGSSKVSYAAPSVDAQAQVIAEAQLVSGVTADTIGYVEGHGTGTAMGDPIEVTALTQAFRETTDKNNFCVLGSVKSNMGHLDAAAGVTGLIKTSLVLKNKMIPPTIHYNKPNPRIDFENSPFYVSNELINWNENIGPRRAGVTSLGMGGTNAHVVLEEAPITADSSDNKPVDLIILSGKTDVVVKNQAANLKKYLENNENVKLSDMAYTLQQGRKEFNHRKSFIGANVNELMLSLQAFIKNDNSIAEKAPLIERPVVFMFPGQGSQYVNMARDLYENIQSFKRDIDECSKIVNELIDVDILDIIYPHKGNEENAEKLIKQTQYTQIVLFIIEYSIAKLFIKIGVNPSSMIGHSIGEYVAACIAQVFTLEEALKLVVLRGSLMSEVPTGKMLSVNIERDELEEIISDYNVSVAAINSPTLQVISGESIVIEKVKKVLDERNIKNNILHTSHAFHSFMMEPILPKFIKCIEKFNLKAPSIPFISNYTGKLILDEEATDPMYWANHLRNTVKFSDGIKELLKNEDNIFLELGPGHVLSILTRNNIESNKKRCIVNTIKGPLESKRDLYLYNESIGKLWEHGININWNELNGPEEIRHRISLPSYPFNHKRYWIDIVKNENSTQTIPLSEENERNNISELTEDRHIKVDEVDGMNSIKKIIKDVWEEMLGIDEIKEDENFFEIGGHSLLATQIVSNIREKFKIDLTVVNLYDSPTIEQLSKIVEELLQKDNVNDESREKVKLLNLEDDEIDIIHQKVPNVESIYPLTNNQQAMMSHNILNVNNGTNIQMFSCIIEGNLNREIFEEAWRKVIFRHPILRTSFLWKGIKEPVQAINKDINVPIVYYDWKDKDHKQQEIDFKLYLQKEGERKYKISKAPQIKMTLIEKGENQYYYVWSYPTNLFDGFSRTIIMKDFFEIYHKMLNNIKIEDEGNYEFYKYIEWLKNKNLDSTKEFWINEFKGFKFSDSDNSDSITDKFEPSETCFKFTEEETKKLNEYARKHGITLGTLVKCSFILLESKLLNSSDFILGVLSSGRSAEIKNTDLIVGNLVNTTPFRVRLDNGKNIEEWLKEINTKQAQINNFEYVTPQQIAKWSNIPVNVIKEGIYERTFVFVNVPDELVYQKQWDDGIEIKDTSDIVWFNVPLRVYGLPGDELRIKMKFNKFRYSQQEIDNMINEMHTILNDIVSNKITQIDLSNYKERM